MHHAYIHPLIGCTRTFQNATKNDMCSVVKWWHKHIFHVKRDDNDETNVKQWDTQCVDGCEENAKKKNEMKWKRRWTRRHRECFPSKLNGFEENALPPSRWTFERTKYELKRTPEPIKSFRFITIIKNEQSPSSLTTHSYSIFESYDIVSCCVL